MNIDKMEFVAWMERIMDRLDILGNHIDDLQKKRNSIDGHNHAPAHGPRPGARRAATGGSAARRGRRRGKPLSAG